MSTLYEQITGGRMMKTASDNDVDTEKLASIADELKAIAASGTLDKKAADETQDEVVKQDEEEEAEDAAEAAVEEDAEEEEEEEVSDEGAKEDIEEGEEVAAEDIIEEAVADAAEGAEEEPVEEDPVEGTPEYEQLMAMLAASANEEKTAAVTSVLSIFEKLASEEASAATEAFIVDAAEKLASEVIENVLNKLDIPLSKYASLFIEDEKTASMIGEQAEKLAADTGASGIQVVEDIINQMNSEE